MILCDLYLCAFNLHVGFGIGLHVDKAKWVVLGRLVEGVYVNRREIRVN